MRLLRFIVLLFPLCSFDASAHPIAQGRLIVTIQKESLKIRMHANVEQLFVANHFKFDAGTTLEEAITQHGHYIQKHLFVEQDQTTLMGRLEEWQRSGVEHIDYDFTFSRPPGGNHIVLRHDILNEIDYAPGNPWEASYQVDVSASQEMNEGTSSLLTSKNSVKIPIQAALDQSNHLFTDYVRFGIDHILEGTDHLLFAGALVLGSFRFIALFKVITAFTVSHSLTLTLSILDFFRLSPLVVEPMIALSIIVAAVLNVYGQAQKNQIRVATALFFGLFHGLGFSGGLLEIMEGLPRSEFVTSLLGFTLGVELGHQIVILPLFLAILFVRRAMSLSQKSMQRLIDILSIPILIGGIYFFWLSFRVSSPVLGP